MARRVQVAPRVRRRGQVRPPERSDKTPRAPEDPPTMKNLAVAYSMNRRAKKPAMSKDCYAEGGAIEGSAERAAADAEEARKRLGAQADAVPAHMSGDEDVAPAAKPDALHDILNRAKGMKKMAAGGVVDMILRDRSGAPEPEQTDEDADEMPEPQEPAFAERVDLSNYHSTEDEEHDDIPATDDRSIVGMILRDRKSRRRG